MQGFGEPRAVGRPRGGNSKTTVWRRNKDLNLITCAAGVRKERDLGSWNTPYPSWNAPYPSWNTPYPSWNTPCPSWNTPYPSWNTPYPSWNTPYPMTEWNLGKQCGCCQVTTLVKETLTHSRAERKGRAEDHSRSLHHQTCGQG